MTLPTSTNKKKNFFAYKGPRRYIALTAVGLNEGANKGYWRQQWRDRYGRWMRMFGWLKFQVRMPDGSVNSVHGQFYGVDRNGDAIVRVKGQPGVRDGMYPVTSKNGAEIMASLDEGYLKSRNITLGKNIRGEDVTSRDAADIPNYEDMQIDELQDEPPTPPEDIEITPDEKIDGTYADVRPGDFVQHAETGDLGQVIEVSETKDGVVITSDWAGGGTDIRQSAGKPDQPITFYRDKPEKP